MPACPPTPCHASQPSAAAFNRYLRGAVCVQGNGLKAPCMHSLRAWSGTSAIHAATHPASTRSSCHTVRLLTLLPQAFDELLLLKPGGATIYFGPLGDDSQRLIEYFQVTGLPVPTSPDSGWAAPASRPVAGCMPHSVWQAGSPGMPAACCPAEHQGSAALPRALQPRQLVGGTAALCCAVLCCAASCHAV